MIPNQLPSFDFDLGDTADMLRDTVMSFSADHVAPIAAQMDQTNTCLSNGNTHHDIAVMVTPLTGSRV